MYSSEVEKASVGYPPSSQRGGGAHALLPTVNTLGSKGSSIGNGLQFLEKVPLFKRLSPADLPQIADAMELVSFAKDTIIFNQGDKGDAFYIIQSGDADVLVQDENCLRVGDQVHLTKALRVGSKMCEKHTKAVIDKFDGSREYPYTIRAEGGPRGRVLAAEIEPLTGPPKPKFLATLRAGDFFGEQSLLQNCHRAATIKSSTPIVCFMLTRDKFKSFRLAEKLNFVKRKAVVALEEDNHAQSSTDLQREVAKSSLEAKLIKQAIRNNKNLTQIIQMDDDKLSRLADCAYKISVKKDTVIIHQGEIFADKFYVVESGEFSFHVKAAAHSERDKVAQNMFMGVARECGSFGELALLYHAPRAATVTCTKAGVLWVIDRHAFKHVLMAANDKKMQDYLDILNNVELLGILMADERAALAEALVEVHYMKGETIIRQGAKGDAFYILYHGDVDVRKDNVIVNHLSANASENKAHTFGERALIKDEPRAASITVISAEAHVLALTREHFERILGSLEDIMLESTADKPRKTHLLQHLGSSLVAESPACNVELSDLRRIGLLGCGGFGTVTLEQHTRTGETFALKALSKGYILKMRTQKGVMREKEIMALCSSPFIIRLYKTLKTKEHLYFLLEPAMGGELFAIYHKYRFHGSVSKAKFYTAAVIFSFEHLHERHVIYRDLKPENLLLDSKGYCKVTDMGLAKIVTGKTYTTCGTPDYFAPEVVQHTGMTKAVDWWTLGVLIHELLSGHAPFEAKDPMETYQKIVRGISIVKFPYNKEGKAPHAQDLVENLLKHAPNERLPLRPGGIVNLKNHRWFHSFDWNAMAKLQMAAPYVPKVRGPADISNFKVHESDMPPQIPYVDPGTGWDDDF
eukprot:GEMP01005237.1.p1 GENE.GEMP01005237.1~~GEMP01005237.1.p1  ORF type:complete len:865 (+),score=197.97 GEMP01005237.1:112-2706(+)